MFKHCCCECPTLVDEDTKQIESDMTEIINAFNKKAEELGYDWNTVINHVPSEFSTTGQLNFILKKRK